MNYSKIIQKFCGFAFVLLILLSVFSSCRKEVDKIQYVDSSSLNSWHLDSTFQFAQKIQLNSLAISDSEALFANNEFLRIVNGNSSFYDLLGKGELSTAISNYYTIWGATYSGNTYYVRPYLSKLLYVGINPTGLRAYGVRHAVSGNYQFNSPTPTQTENYGYGYIGYNWNAISFVNDSSFLYSYTYSSDTAHNDTLKSVLLTLNFDWQGIPILNNQKALSFSLGKYGALNGARPFTYSFYGYTYLLMGPKIFRINENGVYKDLTNASIKLDDVVSMFTIGKYIFAIGDDQSSLTVSEDNGATWHIFSNGINSNLPFLRFGYVGGKTIGIYNAQLFEFTLNGNTLTTKELDNSGLNTNLITSVSQAGRHVFVSTMSGVYYRDTTNFITYK
ncbi:hypothetical protein [Rhizosphaericola mali]|uniref:Uncharacterized protein n=1 Tax=Rhizosphaericola mali TaxID=2545455 RepID=A0A5P2G3D2_9BACT|nr:hypothetical protein [Rhizosphaericola mali]QES89228.1 hypothetical protein E0W69_011325 [Rhizosphaericola mali]